jgi:putative phosphoribosyl transferase
MFTDRRDAGRKLMAALPPLDPERTVIVALPRGGLPVAEVICDALGAPLDIALVRKVGLPGQPELALAAVTDGDEPRITVNEDVARMAGIDAAEIRRLAERELPEIHRRRALYLGGRASEPLRGRSVVVVDDGVATGATLRAALRLIRDAQPARLIVAVPVGPAETIGQIEAECDSVICLERPVPFRAVGLHYDDFAQVDDAEVARIMARQAQRDGQRRGHGAETRTRCGD